VLQKYYYGLDNLVEIERFLHKLTWRRLATIGELMSVITTKTRKASTFVDNNNSPMPFVKERQDVIKEIFKAPIWEDKWA
jgi:hypothetical protein